MPIDFTLSILPVKLARCKQGFHASWAQFCTESQWHPLCVKVLFKSTSDSASGSVWSPECVFKACAIVKTATGQASLSRICSRSRGFKKGLWHNGVTYPYLLLLLWCCIDEPCWHIKLQSYFLLCDLSEPTCVFAYASLVVSHVEWKFSDKGPWSLPFVRLTCYKSNPSELH